MSLYAVGMSAIIPVNLSGGAIVVVVLAWFGRQLIDSYDLPRRELQWLEVTYVSVVRVVHQVRKSISLELGAVSTKSNLCLSSSCGCVLLGAFHYGDTRSVHVDRSTRLRHISECSRVG